jgi:signal transduction histidine kinase
MKVRTPTVIAWSLFGVSVVLSSIAIALSVTRPAGEPLFTIVTALVLAVPFPALGAFVASRQPRNAIGWILSAIGLFQALNISSSEWATYAFSAEPDPMPLAGIATRIAFWSWMPSIGLLITFLLLLFPDGRPPSRRWRWAGWLAGAGLTLTLIGAIWGAAAVPAREFLATDGDPAGFPPLALAAAGTGGVLVFAGALASAASLIVRFRRSRGEERQQIRWMAHAGGFVFVATAIQFLPVAEQEGVGGVLVQGAFLLAILAVPVSMAIAILMHRLYAFDVVVNKAVVYGALAVFATVVYLAVVVGVGTLIGTAGEPNPVLSIAATAVVALAFQPARERARRFANRLVYGRRATPYEVLSAFARRIAGAYSTDDVLPRMAQLVASGTGAVSSRIWLRVGRELRTAAAWPSDVPPHAAVPVAEDELPTLPETNHAFPIVHHGELLGAVSLMVPPGDPLTPSQEKVLRDVSGQAGLVLRNVRLLEELRASRQRLVAAQDEERRRLERNIHDGAQQQLVALAVTLGLAERMIETDPAKAATMVAEAKGATNEALEDLRDLARGIYPPLLADKGLGAAIEGQIRKSPVPVHLDTDGIGRYPQETEAAVCFCCLEALQNVTKYAHANTVTVRLIQTNGGLTFEVSDDGRGFDSGSTSFGTGLQGMADRIEAIGGALQIESEPGAGTTVRGRIPVRALEGSPR